MRTAVRCAHRRAVPVESTVTGETVAALCPDCDVQLPPGFLGCPHDNAIDTPTMGHPPGLQICNDCRTSGWYGDVLRTSSGSPKPDPTSGE